MVFEVVRNHYNAKVKITNIKLDPTEGIDLSFCFKGVISIR
jgi:hypothetical protein